MVRTQRFHCLGSGSIPGWETKIPQAVWHDREKKKKIKNLLAREENRDCVLGSHLTVSVTSP